MLGPHGTALPSSSPSSALGALDHSSLEAQCHSFLVQGLALSTCSSYRSGQRKFYEFCSQLGKLHQSGSPCPADEWTLCLFATFLSSSVQHSTIKVYLSAVHACILSKVFLILLWIVCGYREYLEESREPMAILHLYAYPLQMTS